MKTGLIVILISLLPLCVATQSAILPSPTLSHGIPTSLGMALGKGDVEAITGYLSDKVELTVLDETEIVTKDNAADRLREFYEANEPRGYHIKSVVDHARESGELVTMGGIFRIHIEYVGKAAQREVAILGIRAISDDSVSENTVQWFY